MSIPTKQITVYANGKGQLLTLLDCGIEPNLSGVTLSVDENTMITQMASVTEKLKGILSDECTAVYHDADKLGLGGEFMSLLDSLDEDLSTKIPSSFKGELRKRIAAICIKMRGLVTHPQNSLKGALTRTSEGYYLELWFLDESLSLYKDLVEPVYEVLADTTSEESTVVTPVEAVVVASAVETTPEVIAATPVEAVVVTQVVVPTVRPTVVATPTVQTRAMTPREFSLQFARSPSPRFF